MTSNMNRRRFSTNEDLAWRIEATRSRWMLIQRHAAGKAKFAPIINLVAVIWLWSDDHEPTREERTDVTPDGKDDINVAGPDDRVNPKNNVYNEEPECHGDCSYIPGSIVPGQWKDKESGGYESDGRKFTMHWRLASG
jgi:hypothetical protein